MELVHLVGFITKENIHVHIILRISLNHVTCVVSNYIVLILIGEISVRLYILRVCAANTIFHSVKIKLR